MVYNGIIKSERNKQMIVNDILNSMNWYQKFYLLAMLAGFALSLFTSKKEQYDSRQWSARVSIKGDLFFMFVYLLALIESLVVFVCISIYPVLTKSLNMMFSKVLGFALFSLICVFILKFHFGRKFIRKRLLGKNKIHRYVIGSTVVVMTVINVAIIYKPITMPFLAAIFAIIELVGLDLFKADHKIYEYSFATLLFDGATVMEKIEIDKISKRGKWIIINTEGKDVRMRADSLSRVEYSGEPKVVIIDSGLSCVEKVVQYISKRFIN